MGRWIAHGGDQKSDAQMVGGRTGLFKQACIKIAHKLSCTAGTNAQEKNNFHLTFARNLIRVTAQFGTAIHIFLGSLFSLIREFLQ